MILLHGAAANTTKQALLHAALETDDSDLGRGLNEFLCVRFGSSLVARLLLTSSISTSTLRVQIHGRQILDGKQLSDSSVFR